MMMPFNPLRSLSAIVAAALLPAALTGATGTTTENDASLTVVVREGQSLRDIAQEYFNDPNLWRELLRVNELASADNVKPGLKLKVPRNEITLANAALVESLRVIQEATEAGARVLSADLLESAVRNRQEALSRRQKSDWVGCRDLALAASKDAGKALETTLAQRNQSAQAVLRSFSGTVQSRKTSDLVWNGIGAGASLEETEKVRTLSDSRAEILFVDESRIRLVANSQAVIQRMRLDRLNHQQKASVSLLEGDVYALLSSAGGGRGVDVKVEGVTTNSKSADFWISRKGKETKFANYDSASMDVSSGGETVTLAKNQGTIVVAGDIPSLVRDLLPSPALREPEDGFVSFGDEAPALRWNPIRGAVHYKLEAATDASFSNVVLSRTREPGTEHRPKDLEDGIYYWRVTAVDDLGFPGARSQTRRFQVMRAVAAPYLALESPADGAITREPRVAVRGMAAARGLVTVNGSPVVVADDGAFSVEQRLAEGENVIAIETSGEGGKTTRLERRVSYMPDRPAQIDYHPEVVRLGPRRFVTRGTILTLSGTTTPNARIDVLGTAVSAYSDADGRFRLDLPAAADSREVAIQVKTPSGHVTDDRFTVERDTQPPDLRLASAPDSFTAAESVVLRGSVTGGHELRLNGEPVPLDGDSFVTQLALRPGPNPVQLVASDRVGNEAAWTRTIFRDSDPPALGRTRVSVPRVQGGEIVEITVEASDATEMKRFASVLLRVGSWSETASLALDPAGGGYRGSIRIPLSVQGDVALKHVILEDYLGNKKAYLVK